MKTDRIMGKLRSRLPRLESIARMIGENTPLIKSAVQGRPGFNAMFTKEEYCRLVEMKAKDYIVDGDIFQAVLSRQFKSEYHDSLLNAYGCFELPIPPNMVYLHMDEDRNHQHLS